MTGLAPLITTPRRVKLRVEDYLALDAAGAFDAYGKTELIDGEIVHMNAQHRPHARIKSRLFRMLADALDRIDGRLEALVEGSIAMPPHNVPEPDIAITTEPEGDGLIPLASLALVIEVADTTLRNDLGRKRKIYAREGVPEYWVVDVKDGVIHQMAHPKGAGFATARRMSFGEPITALTIPGLTVSTDRLSGQDA
ncbi:Uma2 family endonuclease [Sphingomonas melonis]|uniref:Uma2 family endonuclease n=1 Tax=Sphingomonas melonis TaxID=152682 RepID=A0A7Y9FP34_9SPHN|nr:Uma2 family endonuclease [Sphingomonas melonis]NYD89716.1 Uma2 family endonuclease [Sphingomonas melonis]